MPNLFYTIGLPRSGKSSIVNKWASKKPMRAIVSSDNIRLALTGKRYEPLAETMVFATKHVMIRALLDRGFDVCVDGTHSTEISIQRILEIDHQAQHVIVDTDLETCIQRAVETNQEDLIPTINRIHNNLKKIKISKDGPEITLGRIVLGTHPLVDFYDNISKIPHYPSFEVYIRDPLVEQINERGLYANHISSVTVDINNHDYVPTFGGGLVNQYKRY